MKPDLEYEVDVNQYRIIGLLVDTLRRQFLEEHYATDKETTRFFYCDPESVRSAKFMTWLFKKYGILEKGLNDGDQIVLIEILKQKS